MGCSGGRTRLLTPNLCATSEPGTPPSMLENAGAGTTGAARRDIHRAAAEADVIGGGSS